MKRKDIYVYVLYKDGEPFRQKGRKTVYLTEGAAKGVITNEVKYDANNEARKVGGYFTEEYQEAYKVAEARERTRYEVVKYAPARQ